MSAHARGFTLLEIMLVVIIMSIMAAIVVPNMFHPRQASLKDEARRLQQVLETAADEAMQSGKPFRWSATDAGYHFEQPDAKGGWTRLTEAPYEAHQLSADVHISEVRTLGASLPAESEDKGVIGRLVMAPDGMLAAADIVLSVQEGAEVVVAVRPGPDIRSGEQR